jgi:hypothetical protein
MNRASIAAKVRRYLRRPRRHDGDLSETARVPFHADARFGDAVAPRPIFPGADESAGRDRVIVDDPASVSPLGAAFHARILTD